MILFGVMCFIENQQVYLIHPHIRVKETLVQDLRRAYYHHVGVEMVVPGLLAPQVCSHGTEKLPDILVDIVAQNGSLLVNERNAIHLLTLSYPRFLWHAYLLTRKNEIRGGFPWARSFSSFSITCFNRSTAINVFPDPRKVGTVSQSSPRKREWFTQHVPVSKTAIVFCALALSKSSSWYSRGSNDPCPRSRLATRCAVESSASGISGRTVLFASGPESARLESLSINEILLLCETVVWKLTVPQIEHYVLVDVLSHHSDSLLVLSLRPIPQKIYILAQRRLLLQGCPLGLQPEQEAPSHR